MHRLVSSKLNLSRSDDGYSCDVSGLIAIPVSSSISVADVRKTLMPLFSLSDLPTRKFASPLTTSAAVKSFVDDGETTNNTKRKFMYGSSSALPAALPKTAIDHLIANLPPAIFVSLYTSGGASRSGIETSLHPSEFIAEWTTYSTRRDPEHHRRIEKLRSGVVRRAGFEDHGFPNYPDDENRSYFKDRRRIEEIVKSFDPRGLSTSSLSRVPSSDRPRFACR
jgi:hypothetical protein